MDMDGKNFLVRECAGHFTEDFGLGTRIARYHNIYGPLGTFDGGREKAPAVCRKIIQAKKITLKALMYGGMENKLEAFFI